MTSRLLLVIAGVACFAASAFAGPGTASPFHGRRVLIIGVDGCRADALRLATSSGAAPNIAGLVRGGTVTWNCFAGGLPAPSATNQPTLSGPGWSSILTGTWTDKHWVVNNDFSPSNFVTYPAFMRRVKEVAPGAYVASAVSWRPIDTGCIGPSQNNGAEYMDSRFKGPSSDYHVRDQQVRDQVVSLLGTANPDVVFVHLDQVDDTGHASGFSPTNPAYMNAITLADGLVGNMLAAMRARPQFAQENWCVIMTTDHGGVGKNHGGQSSDERTTWLIVNGGSAQAGRVSTEKPGQTCIPATAMQHLGVPLNANWGMDATVFALGL